MLMLKFFVGDISFACDCEPIIEIIPLVKLQTISSTPSFIVGLVNFGGTPIPVIDFCQLMDDRPASQKMNSRIILLKNPDVTSSTHLLGLLAENVTQIFEENPSSFIESGIKPKNFNFLGGVLHSDHASIQMIDISKLFEYLTRRLLNSGQ